MAAVKIRRQKTLESIVAGCPGISRVREHLSIEISDMMAGRLT
jgi:hypothetical protein